MTHQKRTITFFIILLATPLLWGGTILRFGSGTGQVGGDDYALPVILQNDCDIAGLQFVIQDAQNVLHVDSIAATSRTGGWIAMHNENNLLLFNLHGKPVHPGAGEIATLFLHIDSTATAGMDTVRTATLPLLADTLGEKIDSLRMIPGLLEIQSPTFVKSKTTGESSPLSYTMEQNYPNPFNPTTTIRFTLKKPARTIIEMYNTTGEMVRNLVNQDLKAGSHILRINAQGLAAGIYFYKISANNFVAVKKMVLIK